MAKVRPLSCAGAARADPSGIQLATSFQPVSTRCAINTASSTIVLDIFFIDSAPPTALDGFCHTLWPPRSVSRHDAFAASLRRFSSSSGLLLLSWSSPSAAVSLGSSGSSGVFLSEFSSHCSRCSCTRSNLLGRFCQFLASSSRNYALDVSASELVRATSELVSDLFPSSCELWGSYGRFTGSSGGGRGYGGSIGTSSTAVTSR